jgi:uncharacterized membrane protein YkoI
MKNYLLKTVAAASLVCATAFAAECVVTQTDNAKAKSACNSCCKAKKCKTAKSQKYIGKKAAIDAALAHAGLERSAIRDLSCELERENGVMIYEVEFESGSYDYEYDIDAVTGKVLRSKKELD